MSYWVGAYIEAGMGVSGSSGTPYLPFVFQAPDKATAQKNAGAKLLSGPYSTEAAANAWVTAYEKNPSTVHAGSDIPSGPGQPVTGSGTGPGGTGTVKGDTPPAPADPLTAIAKVVSSLGSKNLYIRGTKVLVGGALLLIAVSHATGAGGAVARAARKVPVII